MKLVFAAACVFSLAVASLQQPAFAQAPAASGPTTVFVHADQPGIALNPYFYGLMTEEINHAFDGGLYAELIQNRDFKMDLSTPVHWSMVQEGGGTGQVSISTDDPATPSLTNSLKLLMVDCGPGQKVGVANEGYWGIPVSPKTTYTASFFAEGGNGFTGPLLVRVESADGSTVYAQSVIRKITGTWARYRCTLKTGQVSESTNNRFSIYALNPGSLRLSLVSLFPPTYNNRPNGNRIDLMQKLAAMKPEFLRMPGGNYLDPGHLIWKNTIGPIEDRPGSPGAWSYQVTQGLGLLEMLEWCEDLHMLPLLAVSDGRGWLPDGGDVSPLVQDALDEIQYVSGPVSTTWGARRAKDGHPAPFPLKYVEVGNEDFFSTRDVYDSRFTKFYDAILTC